jgi:hypothetical protein
MAIRRGMPPRLATLEYVVEVAKDWTLARFAAAQNSEFVLMPHRFELCGSAIQRHAISPDSPEATSPFDAVRRTPRPTAWSHSAVATILCDCETGTVEHEQEVVEILALDGDDVLAEVAYVIRIVGLPPCLGPFSSP